MTSAIDRRHVGARLSETAIFNGTVYLAGQIPENSPGADIKTQTQEVLATSTACWPKPAPASKTFCSARST